MNKEIKFFKVDWENNSNLNLLLKNIKQNSKQVFFLDPRTKENRNLASLKDIIDNFLLNKLHIRFNLTTQHLVATLEVTSSYIKLYPEPPFKFKLHRDEQTHTVDYITYLELLLTLCQDLDINAAGTKENLDDYF